MDTLYSNRWLLVILGFFFLMGVLFAVINPVFEAPDESGHLSYINYVSKTGKLPSQLKEGQYVYEGHHPPLFYWLGAFINHMISSDNSVEIKEVKFEGEIGSTIPNKTFHEKNDKINFFVLRFISLLTGLLTIVFTYKLAGLFFKQEIWSLLVVVLIAALPQFLFISSIINNDGMVILFSTAAIYFIYKLMQSPKDRNNWLWLGVCMGLALLAKKSALFLLPIVAMAVVYLIYGHKVKVKTGIIHVALMAVTTFAISGWWYIRNRILYGDYLGTRMEMTVYSGLVDRKSLLSAYFSEDFFRILYRSAIGIFGLMNVWLPIFVYQFYKYLLIIAVIGLAVCIYKKRGQDIKPFLALGLIGSSLIGVIIYNLTYSQPQGRFILPVISIISVLVVLGIKTLTEYIKYEWIQVLIPRLLVMWVGIISLISIIKLHNHYFGWIEHTH